MSPLSCVTRYYFSHFPIEKGKWLAWQWFQHSAAYAAFDRGEYETLESFHMTLDPAERIDRFIYWWGCWEPNETWFVKRTLGPGDTFVDVGANDGYFSLLASSIVGHSGRVIAFEPVPSIVTKLKSNLALNGVRNVRVVESAVSNVAGCATITMPSGTGSGMSTMRAIAGPCWQVPTTRLDVALKSEGRIRLVKVDVEGAELMALKGFSERLESAESPTILCEITQSFLRQLGSTSEELYSWMAGFGYRAFQLEHKRVTPLDDAVAKRRDQINVVFAKRVSKC